MDDRQKAELVNDLTQIAIDFAGTQQLREQIRCRLLPELEKFDRGELAIYEKAPWWTNPNTPPFIAT